MDVFDRDAHFAARIDELRPVIDYFAFRVNNELSQVERARTSSVIALTSRVWRTHAQLNRKKLAMTLQ